MTLLCANDVIAIDLTRRLVGLTLGDCRVVALVNNLQFIVCVINIFFLGFSKNDIRRMTFFCYRYRFQ